MATRTSPRVSIILPTHNRATLLRRSLGSVLAQTFTDFEVIVVENACTDETSKVLDEVRDPRLRRLVLPVKQGASAARNAGLAQSRAELIAFQDDDDVWLISKLALQLRALEDAGSNTGLCLCGLIRLTPHGIEPRFADGFFREIDFTKGVGLANFSVIATPGWLVRRRYLEQSGGFDEDLPARNDWELALRLRDYCDFTYVRGPLFLQDQRHETTMQRNESAYSKALQRIVSLHQQRWTGHPRVMARHAEIIGRHEVSVGNSGAGRAWLRRSLSAWPWQPRIFLLYGLSFLGAGVVSWLRGIRRAGAEQAAMREYS